MIRSYKSWLVIVLIIVSFFSVKITINSSISKQDFSSKDALKPNCQNNDLVEMDYFPVDLDYLFYADNYTVQRERLNFLGNDSYGFMVTPWGGHFVGGHIEGNDKWYITSYGRQAEIRAPQTGIVSEILIENGTLAMKDGHEIMLGMGLYLDLGSDCCLGFGHMDLLKSIYDDYQLGGTLTLTANQLMGYTHNSSDFSGLDFYYWHNARSICPYNTLNAELKTQFENYFQLQYDTCKLAGTYPETNICVNLDVSIENTVWGVWQYEHGPYDDIFYETNDVGLYDFAFIDFFSINKTNPETFHKDPRNRALDLPEDVVGIFTDNCNGLDIPEYNYIGVSLAKLVSGNYKDGLIEVFPYYPNTAWGVDSLLVKFLLYEGSDGLQDDKLYVEYFTDPFEAQTGFTSNNMTYIRYNIYDEDKTNKIPLNIAFVISFFVMNVLIVYYRKKGKNK